MTNKENFIKSCLVLFQETDLETQKTLCVEIVNIFKNSKMIPYTYEKDRLRCISEIQDLLTKYTLKTEFITDIEFKNTYILYSELIGS
ncbi:MULTISPECIES: hypothetical protein [unclassified Flavobacterium]|jgi:hypothetical protein|uniref:hypothetical protein n=1 Tax=unclassified Flavobacterium TaxID=196869 RepID=UPI0025B9EA47|nr:MULTISPECIES: hypothetical protein [unclassified Flavobacterium]